MYHSGISSHEGDFGLLSLAGPFLSGLCSKSGFPEDSFSYSVLVTYAVSDRVNRRDNKFLKSEVWGILHRFLEDSL